MVPPSLSTKNYLQQSLTFLSMLKTRQLQDLSFCCIRQKKKVEEMVQVKMEVQIREVREFIRMRTPEVKMIPFQILRARPTMNPKATDQTTLSSHKERKQNDSTPQRILSIFRLLDAITAADFAPVTKLCPVKAIVMILYLFSVFTNPSTIDRHGFNRQILTCAHMLSVFFWAESAIVLMILMGVIDSAAKVMDPKWLKSIHPIPVQRLQEEFSKYQLETEQLTRKVVTQQMKQRIRMYQTIWVSRQSYPKVLVMVSKAIICRRPAAERIRTETQTQANPLTKMLTQNTFRRALKNTPTIFTIRTQVLKCSLKTQNIARTQITKRSMRMAPRAYYLIMKKQTESPERVKTEVTTKALIMNSGCLPRQLIIPMTMKMLITMRTAIEIQTNSACDVSSLKLYRKVYLQLVLLQSQYPRWVRQAENEMSPSIRTTKIGMQNTSWYLLRSVRCLKKALLTLKAGSHSSMHSSYRDFIRNAFEFIIEVFPNNILIISFRVIIYLC